MLKNSRTPAEGVDDLGSEEDILRVPQMLLLGLTQDTRDWIFRAEAP